MIRTLIVDDEPHARETLRLRVAAEDELELVGECASGDEAVRAVRALRPDLVFLDVRMPDRSGFSVLKALEPAERPFIVFVTAYDEYAMRAFEVHALAYLLKPFDDVRFAQTMTHVRRLLADAEDAHRRIDGLVTELRTAAIDRLVVKTGRRTHLVPAAEVDWIQAEGNYARLHCGTKSHLASRSIGELAEMLDARRFVRIHRSAIVNVDRIRELRTDDHRDFVVVLTTGVQLRLSRTFRRALEQAIGDRL